MRTVARMMAVLAVISVVTAGGLACGPLPPSALRWSGCWPVEPADLLRRAVEGRLAHRETLTAYSQITARAGGQAQSGIPPAPVGKPLARLTHPAPV